MTESRQDTLLNELHELQRSYYYDHKEKRELKHLLKVVNGNKDRLITILAIMLAETNGEIGNSGVLGEMIQEQKTNKINEILLRL